MMNHTVRIALAFTLITFGLYLLLSGCSRSNETAAKSVAEQVHYRIIGIDAGSGSMVKTAEVMKSYGLDKWDLVEGSDAAMTAALTRAYKKKEPIIITGWTPHWMFKKFDLKYLEDPMGGFGGSEAIHTIVRKGLKEQHPSAYQFLDRFYWTPADMEEVMVQVMNGKTPEYAAAKWVKQNDAKVAKWVEGIAPVNGDELKIAYVAWDTEIASSHVVEAVLKQKLGYHVKLSQVETGPMWAGVAAGDVDGMVAAWLPSTDMSYFEKFKGRIEDLGPNLEGTRIGLVVPAYMNIQSIADLK